VKKLEPGALVQVRDDALRPGAQYGGMNRSIVEEHGYLWFVEECEVSSPYVYTCRSLATGERAAWMVEELNVLKEQADG
jgi:hypothetical protein